VLYVYVDEAKTKPEPEKIQRMETSAMVTKNSKKTFSSRPRPKTCRFREIHCCLTPRLYGAPANIRINLILPESIGSTSLDLLESSVDLLANLSVMQRVANWLSPTDWWMIFCSRYVRFEHFFKIKSCFCICLFFVIFLVGESVVWFFDRYKNIYTTDCLHGLLDCLWGFFLLIGFLF